VADLLCLFSKVLFVVHLKPHKVDQRKTASLCNTFTHISTSNHMIICSGQTEGQILGNSILFNLPPALFFVACLIVFSCWIDIHSRCIEITGCSAASGWIHKCLSRPAMYSSRLLLPLHLARESRQLNYICRLKVWTLILITRPGLCLHSFGLACFSLPALLERNAKAGTVQGSLTVTCTILLPFCGCFSELYLTEFF
jgi:hypothetical protein